MDRHSQAAAGPWGPLSRRSAIGSALGAAAAAAGAGLLAQGAPAAGASAAAPPQHKRYDLKKSINLWAFPYPQKMTLEQCLRLAKDAGFDGIELNYDLESDLSPRSGTKEFSGIRAMAEKIGIAISGLCSFLFWPYPLSSNDVGKRNRGIELAGKMLQAAHDLGTKNLLVVPGAVTIPWRDDHEPVAFDACEQRARQAVGAMVKTAEKLGVSLNIENIFFNGFLMTPMECNAFVDSFSSPHVKVHFDTGNMLFQQPEHWIPILGKRIGNTHFKEMNQKGTDHTLAGFRTLLDGTINWPAVIESLDATGYRGYCTFEFFHPFAYYPEALIYQTSDALDRMLGRKG